MPTQHLQAYARRIRDALRANPAIPETGLAPAFQRLVAELLPLLATVPELTVSPEYNSPGVGRPDIALIRQGQPARAFVELKAPVKPADPERWRDAHDKRQYERLKELGAWSASNFADFLLFSRETRLGAAAIVPPRALQPDTPNAVADQLVAEHDSKPFLDLLATLARADAPEARNAEHLAQLMAHSARLVRSAVHERLGQLQGGENARHPLIMVRETFRNVLYAHPEAGGYSATDFDTLFSSAFAQTLAFGLLLVREATDREIDENAWRDMPDEHPLMKAALEILSDRRVSLEVGIGFEVMCDTVNSFAPEILALRSDGTDPILYFYEDFLATFDPKAREKYGVYYTPIEVVRYMTGALDRALRENLGTQGLRDPAVTILDPATGTGTFLLGVAERVRDQVMADEGGVAGSLALRDLAGRMYGFELLVGPYAVAHYRLHHALRNRAPDEEEVEPQRVNLARLGIYLADTLSQPDAIAPIGALGIQGIPIDEERQEANRIKAREPILAIMGNPPYRRLEEGEDQTLVGRWMAGGLDEAGRPERGIWDDLKQPVKNAGQGGQLNTFPEFSIAFWRWAIWKLFEADNAPRRGVIAFISNRKFLTGWPYAGLRKMLRERFDRIEVIDLRGDVNTGPQATVERDQGVFNITVGTAITVAIADGSKAEGALADIQYTDSWAQSLFTRRAKLDWLLNSAGAGRMDESVDVRRELLDDFRPAPFENGDWLSLREAFGFNRGGIQTKRDRFAYAASDILLRERIRGFLRMDVLSASAIFSPTGARPLEAARSSLAACLESDTLLPIIRSAYRPLDRRWLCNHNACVDRPRPELQAAWGSNNLGLYSLKSNTGAGPGVWCHGLLPDYHAIKGSNGGYAFPLYDRREGPDAHNLNPVLVAALAEAYGAAQTPNDIFDAILCLLSARSYTRLFAEDLEDVFPHIPFPADPTVFARAAEIGREIRGLEAFERGPAAAYRLKAFCKIVGEPDDNTVVADIGYADGTLSLWKDRDIAVPAFTGLPEAVWSFSVSGYRVLPRWIEGRKGLPVTLSLMRELRDAAARIAELIHWFDAADIVLNATLGDTLTREELGFPAPAQEAENEGYD
ncbi:MAG: hypothetical protein QOD42_1749 [Sphingomonadales bacterium]|jgi:hypothetical protein|nr:hypothetical protein [Sphingomonadales bacterium]